MRCECQPLESTLREVKIPYRRLPRLPMPEGSVPDSVLYDKSKVLHGDQHNTVRQAARGQTLPHVGMTVSSHHIDQILNRVRERARQVVPGERYSSAQPNTHIRPMVQ